VAMFPAYGLAEATLAVTFPDRLLETEIKTFHRQTLLKEGLAVETGPDDATGIDLVNLGTQIDHCEMKVTDDVDQPVADCRVGNILVRGRNVTRGYFGNPEKTAASFTGDWLQTGDLGFLFKGNLFITGRSKDIIFINGINYYAHDLETIAMQMDGVTHGKIVIAGSFDENEGRDKLMVFVVGGNNEDTRNLCQQLKNHFANKIGLTTDLFIPVRSADIPRTSSGKLQRYKMVERYLKGHFPNIIQF
jgi:acyl-CoA synthetase (AMP-forming)/AMP-acid ligase II